MSAYKKHNQVKVELHKFVRFLRKMLKLLSIFVLLAAATATPATRHHYEQNALKANAGRTPGRIVGGVDTDIENFPYQIALFFNQRFTCGGSIFNPTTIVSAAHCTQ